MIIIIDLLGTVVWLSRVGVCFVQLYRLFFYLSHTFDDVAGDVARALVCLLQMFKRSKHVNKILRMVKLKHHTCDVAYTHDYLLLHHT